jgi:hypothetical protein
MGQYTLTVVVNTLTEIQANQLLDIIKSTVVGANATLTVNNSTYQSNVTG